MQTCHLKGTSCWSPGAPVPRPSASSWTFLPMAHAPEFSAPSLPLARGPGGEYTCCGQGQGSSPLLRDIFRSPPLPHSLPHRGPALRDPEPARGFLLPTGSSNQHLWQKRPGLPSATQCWPPASPTVSIRAPYPAFTSSSREDARPEATAGPHPTDGLEAQDAGSRPLGSDPSTATFQPGRVGRLQSYTVPQFLHA